MALMTCLIQCTVVGCDDRRSIYAAVMTSFSTYRLLDPRVFEPPPLSRGTALGTSYYFVHVERYRLDVLLTLIAGDCLQETPLSALSYTVVTFKVCGYT